MKAPKKKDSNKEKILNALETSLGVVTEACKQAKIGRTTFYKYYKSDESFKEKVDDISDVAIDFAETKLFENIKKGKEVSIIFYLKTKGKKRGYVEKLETDIIVNKPIIIDFSNPDIPANE